MKIASIKASLHRHAIRIDGIAEALEQRQFVFVEVETDTGHTGFGVTGQFLPWAVIPCIENHIFPVLKGMDPRDTERIHHAVWKKLNPRTYTGVISNALSAIDIALWDLRGKAEGRSVAGLLGGYSDRCPAYATFGYAYFNHEELAAYANKFIDMGFDAVKMVVGDDGHDWKEDARRVKAVRRAIPDHVELLIDGNYFFSPAEARLLCREIEDCGITWFEEPVHQNDTRAMADLRMHTRIPLAAGQMEGHRWRFRDLVLHQAVDFVQPNCCYNGGYTESAKVAHMAQAFNLPIANGGGWPIFNMHLMAGLMNGGRVEFHYGMWEAGKRFFKGAPDPDGNMLIIPDGPGLGFTADRDQLNDCRVNSPDRAASDQDAHGYTRRKKAG
ncbi:mandelate racemase/muconate lactonizing enzyme family protein [Chelativorans sp. J32]|uniref:mandelate racemase/muconate lactonizing enzyme family protein n=1 Tax=Chelativorans sp. J32 TaxID=935840 RepID=UPI0004822485|nr:mandelate racemase/muconate lactonizing enzyme family protein [Chelativorans sp. J32]